MEPAWGFGLLPLFQGRHLWQQTQAQPDVGDGNLFCFKGLKVEKQGTFWRQKGRRSGPSSPRRRGTQARHTCSLWGTGPSPGSRCGPWRGQETRQHWLRVFSPFPSEYTCEHGRTGTVSTKRTILNVELPQGCKQGGCTAQPSSKIISPPPPRPHDVRILPEASETGRDRTRPQGLGLRSRS